jgi:hypothetical protein
VLDLRAGSTLAAKNFAFRQMDAAGIRIGANVAIAPAPLDLRNGLFDLPADGGRLLELVRAAPSGFRYLRFENTLGASGAVNVRVPAFSDAIELVNWSGAFAGPGFEDDPGNLLTWGPPEASDVSGFTADWKPDHVRLSWTTSAEVDTESWIVTRSPEPPGLFVSAGGLPAAGPGSYGFSDFQVSAATAYRYRLYERLTHGALVLQDELMLEASELPVLLPNWGQPAPPPPPPLPFVVGPGGVFPDVGTALAALSGTHRGERVGLELAAGVHAAFELAGSSLGFDLALTARPGAVIDASLAPLRITGLPPERSLELAGLVIEAGGAFHPALGVEDCAGVVLLDALAVHGSANGSGVELRGARCVALQGCELAGAPALSLGRGSRASLRGAEPAAEVEPGSLLRACLDGARLVPGERRLALEDGGEGLAWLLAAPRLGFAAPTDARVTGDLLLERTGLRVLAGPRALLEGRTSWRLPEGAPYRYFQALVVDRAGARFALSPVRAGER